jgi:hypothetical protein
VPVSNPGTVSAGGSFVAKRPENYGAVRDGVTNDTAAVQAALDAAVAACIADGSFYCEVQFSAGIYQLSSATTKGGTSRGNAQITLPNREPTAGQKVTIVLKGLSDAGAISHWQQVVAQQSGVVLRSSLTGQTPDGTWKSPSVIGGPTVALAGGGEFSNIRVVTDGITISAPVNPSVIGGDFRRCAQWDFPNTSAIVNGTVTTMAVPTDSNGIGFYAPSINNNDSITGHKLTVAGFYYCVGCSDHFACDELTTLYYNTAMYLNTGGSSAYVHGIHVGYWSSEAGATILEKSNDAGNHIPVSIDRLDVETQSGTPFKDAGNNLHGHISYAANDGTDPFPVTGCANVRIENVNRTRGTLTAPAVPASTVAATVIYKDAMVVVVGGTVTAITVDGVATGLTSGSVFVPCGKTIAVTYSVAPTWKWWLL